MQLSKLRPDCGPARRLGLRLSLAAAIAATAFLAGPGAAQAAYNWTSVDNAISATGIAKTAIVIQRNGTPIHVRGFGGIFSGAWHCNSDTTPGDCDALDNPIAVASVSKTYSAVIVLAAIEDTANGLSLTDTLGHWVSGASSAYSNITIGEALAMISSVENLNELDTTNSCLGSNLWTLSSCTNNLDKTTNWPLDPYTHGTEFGYSAASWTILGQAIVNAVHAAYPSTVSSWADVANKYLLGSGKCDWGAYTDGSGIQHGTYYTPSNNPLVSGGVYTGLFEGAAFAEMLRTGKCGSNTILSATSLALMRANSTPRDGSGAPVVYWSPLSSNGGTYNGDGRGYGYGLWLSDYTYPTPHAGSTDLRFGVGAYGSVLFFEDNTRQLSGFLLVSSLNSSAFQTSVTLSETLMPLIEAQIDANP